MRTQSDPLQLGASGSGDTFPRGCLSRIHALDSDQSLVRVEINHPHDVSPNQQRENMRGLLPMRTQRSKPALCESREEDP
jgi:hypothetical protein